MSEKRSLLGAAAVVSEWAGRLQAGLPVAELYTDWDWGSDAGDATWDEDEDEGEGAASSE
jgi:hypothetical protein